MGGAAISFNKAARTHLHLLSKAICLGTAQRSRHEYKSLQHAMSNNLRSQPVSMTSENMSQHLSLSGRVFGMIRWCASRDCTKPYEMTPYARINPQRVRPVCQVQFGFMELSCSDKCHLPRDLECKAFYHRSEAVTRYSTTRSQIQASYNTRMFQAASKL